MTTFQEVKNAIDAVKSEGNKQIVAIHCTTSYPCPLKGVNLRAWGKEYKNENLLIKK